MKKKQSLFIFIKKIINNFFILYCINILIQYEIPIHFKNPEN
jgi:hypothetical protein